MQSSDNRKKISFRWNSRIASTGAMAVASKPVEQQLTESADSGKLVPYEDDISDDSEPEKEAAEATESVHVTVEQKPNVYEGCADMCEKTRSLDVTCLLNGEIDDSVNTNHREKLMNPAQPIVTSSADSSVLGCVKTLSSSASVNSGTVSMSETSSLLPLSEVESTEAEKKAAATLLSGTAEDSLAVLGDGDMGFAADKGNVAELKNGDLSSNNDAISHTVTGRKRHARHKSKKRHAKHRRSHATQSSTSQTYSSDEEVEYVWVEKTSGTIAQQLTGKCHL